MMYWARFRMHWIKKLCEVLVMNPLEKLHLVIRETDRKIAARWT
jgi:hypothetical protein